MYLIQCEIAVFFIDFILSFIHLQFDILTYTTVNASEKTLKNSLTKSILAKIHLFPQKCVKNYNVTFMQSRLFTSVIFASMSCRDFHNKASRSGLLSCFHSKVFTIEIPWPSCLDEHFHLVRCFLPLDSQGRNQNGNARSGFY